MSEERFLICLWNDDSPDDAFEESWQNREKAVDRFKTLCESGRFGWGAVYDMAYNPNRAIATLPEEWDGHT